MKSNKLLFIVFTSLLFSSCRTVYRNGTTEGKAYKPIYPKAWANKEAKITLLNDTLCIFQKDRKWFNGDDSPHAETVILGKGHRIYGTELTTSYKILHDTLTIYFDRCPDNLYKIKRNRLFFLKKVSSSQCSTTKARFKLISK
jgi:hypothetical protein